MADIDREPGDTEGMALASFVLASITFRMLVETEIFSRDDAHAILRGILLPLEQVDEVTDPAVQAARALLSDLGTQVGLPQISLQ